MNETFVLYSALYNKILWKNPYNLPMKREIAFILMLIVCGLGVWAGSSRLENDQTIKLPDINTTELPNPLETEGNQFVAKASQMLAQYGPVQAKIRAEINMFDQTIRASGVYIQQGQGSPKSRTEMRFGNGDESTHFVQVHDGFSLHTKSKGQSAGIEKEISAGKKSKGDYYYVNLNRVNWKTTKSNGIVAGPFGWSFVGGIASTLDHCAVAMEFSDPKPVRLESMDAVEVTGHWRIESIQRMMESQVNDNSNQFEWDQLPPHLPSGVKLTFSDPNSNQVAFPHRIEFFQYQQTNTGVKTIPIATFELFELGRLKELPDSTFKISSDDIEIVDDSELYKNRVIQFTR